jgi:hypothetical protein
MDVLVLILKGKRLNRIPAAHQEISVSTTAMHLDSAKHAKMVAQHCVHTK